MILNHIILSAKFYIYRCKIDKVSPSLAVFKIKLKAMYKLETFIARKNNALLKHYGKGVLSGMIQIPKLYPSKHLAKIFAFQVECFQVNIGRYCYLPSVIKNIKAGVHLNLNEVLRGLKKG